MITNRISQQGPVQREKHITHLWGGTANPWIACVYSPQSDYSKPQLWCKHLFFFFFFFRKPDLNYIARSVHTWIVKLITIALKQQECLMHEIKAWQLVVCELLKQVSDMESAGASDTTGAEGDWKENHHWNRHWQKPDPPGYLVHEDVLPVCILFLHNLLIPQLKEPVHPKPTEICTNKYTQFINYLKHTVTQISLPYLSIQICIWVELGLMLLVHKEKLLSTWAWNQPFSHTKLSYDFIKLGKQCTRFMNLLCFFWNLITHSIWKKQC